MKKHSIRAAVLLVALAVIFGTAGCSLLGIGNEEVVIPLEANLIFEGGTFETVQAHPQDANGLLVSIEVSENCKIDWGDKSSLEDYEGIILHHYFTRQGSYTVKASVVDGDTLKEKKLYVVLENQNPYMADFLTMDFGYTGGGSSQSGMSPFIYRENLTIPLNPRVAGCDSTTGEFTYSYGTFDPDGDEIRFRIRALKQQEGLVDGIRAKWFTIEEWAVFSLHDRSLISGIWSEIMGFWLQTGWKGMIPPFPFATVSRESLLPREHELFKSIDAMSTSNSFKSLIGDLPPLWPPCEDCDDPDPDPDPDDPVIEYEGGDCYLRIIVQVMDRFGGYNQHVWDYPLVSCDCSGCSSPYIFSPIKPPCASGCGETQ